MSGEGSVIPKSVSTFHNYYSQLWGNNLLHLLEVRLSVTELTN